VGIGATVFFTGVFAALAAGYAMFTVFDSYWISVVLGLVWGLLIFNLDRYIVSSMRKEGNSRHELKTALPRIILAVLISIVIVKPLELKIFEKEINAELIIMEQQTYTAQEAEIRSRYDAERRQAQDRINNLKNELVTKTAARDTLVKRAQEEADGTGGTRVRNAGPIYKIKKADADRAAQELDELSRANNLQIEKQFSTLTRIDSLLQSDIVALERQRMDGPAARMEALNRLTQKSSAVWLANIFVILLFIAIETAPVLVKLIAGRGPYDHLLKTLEHTFDTRRIEDQASQHAAIKQRTQELSATEKGFVAGQLDIRLNDLK
jgi:hypothetical protein